MTLGKKILKKKSNHDFEITNISRLMMLGRKKNSN